MKCGFVRNSQIWNTVETLQRGDFDLWSLQLGKFFSFRLLPSLFAKHSEKNDSKTLSSIFMFCGFHVLAHAIKALSSLFLPPQKQILLSFVVSPSLKWFLPAKIINYASTWSPKLCLTTSEDKTDCYYLREEKTLPEAQQTQGIEFETWIISEAWINRNSFQSKR